MPALCMYIILSQSPTSVHSTQKIIEDPNFKQAVQLFILEQQKSSNPARHQYSDKELPQTINTSLNKLRKRPNTLLYYRRNVLALEFPNFVITQSQKVRERKRRPQLIQIDNSTYCYTPRRTGSWRK